MYDFHAHILPTVDHGSRTESDAAAQLDLLVRNGITHVSATPHFYPDEWNNTESFLSVRRKGEELLRPLLAERSISVSVGAEVLVSEGLEHMEKLADLCLAGTNLLLLEMPFFKWNDRLYKTVSRLCRSGFSVLLAHIDRYPCEDVERLFDMGAVGQVNCEAFLHHLRRRKYRSYVRQGLVCALGSDLHLPTDYREKAIVRARTYLGEELMGKLCAFGEQKFASAEKINP